MNVGSKTNYLTGKVFGPIMVSILDMIADSDLFF